MKLKYAVVLLLGFLGLLACSDDGGSGFASYDAEKYAKEDDEALVEYLQNHYLNPDDGLIWSINNGETPLIDQVETLDIVKNEVDFKMYYLKQFEGVNEQPTVADSVLTTYRGMLLDSTVFDARSTFTWFSLTSVIDGWGHGFKHFKSGTKVLNPDESFYFENYGQGILFIPSGLGYANRAQTNIPENSPLIFYFTLQAVNRADHDNDGILSIDEDLDGDENVKNDDTDGDNVPNYLDPDDDGDGTLTADEDANGDGDPTNDDSDGDGTPDYLDPDTK
jgi:hypothetical protein